MFYIKKITEHLYSNKENKVIINSHLRKSE